MSEKTKASRWNSDYCPSFGEHRGDADPCPCGEEFHQDLQRRVVAYLKARGTGLDADATARSLLRDVEKDVAR